MKKTALRSCISLATALLCFLSVPKVVFTPAYAEDRAGLFIIEETIKEEDVLTGTELLSETVERFPQQCKVVTTRIERQTFQKSCAATLILKLHVNGILNDFLKLQDPENFPDNVKAAFDSYNEIEALRQAAIEALSHYQDLQKQLQALQLAMDDQARAEAVGDLNAKEAAIVAKNIQENGGVIDFDALPDTVQGKINNRKQNVYNRVLGVTQNRGGLATDALQDYVDYEQIELKGVENLKNIHDIPGERIVLPGTVQKKSDVLKKELNAAKIQLKVSENKRDIEIKQNDEKLRAGLNALKFADSFRFNGKELTKDETRDFLRDEHRIEQNIINAQYAAEEKKIVELNEKIANAGNAVLVQVARPNKDKVAHLDQEVDAGEAEVAGLQQLLENTVDKPEKIEDLERQLNRAKKDLEQAKERRRRVGDGLLNQSEDLRLMAEQANILRQQIADAIAKYEPIANEYNRRVGESNDALATIQAHQDKLNEDKEALQAELTKVLLELSGQEHTYCLQTQKFDIGNLLGIKFPPIIILPADVQKILDSLQQGGGEGGGGGGKMICTTEQQVERNRIRDIELHNASINLQIRKIPKPPVFAGSFAESLPERVYKRDVNALKAQLKPVPEKPDCQQINIELPGRLVNNTKLDGTAELTRQKSILKGEVQRLEKLIEEVYNSAGFQIAGLGRLFLQFGVEALDPRGLAELFFNPDAVAEGLVNLPGLAVEELGKTVDSLNRSTLNQKQTHLQLVLQVFKAKQLLNDPNSGSESVEEALKAIDLLAQTGEDVEQLKKAGAAFAATVASTRIPFFDEAIGVLGATARITGRVASILPGSGTLGNVVLKGAKRVVQSKVVSGSIKTISNTAQRIDDATLRNLPTFRALGLPLSQTSTALRVLVNRGRLSTELAGRLSNGLNRVQSAQAVVHQANRAFAESNIQLDELRLKRDATREGSPERIVIDQQIAEQQTLITEQQQKVIDASSKADDVARALENDLKESQLNEQDIANTKNADGDIVDDGSSVAGEDLINADDKLPTDEFNKRNNLSDSDKELAIDPDEQLDLSVNDIDGVGGSQINEKQQLADAFNQAKFKHDQAQSQLSEQRSICRALDQCLACFYNAISIF